MKMIDSARFFRVYANLPIPERSNVCCAFEWGRLIGVQPFSWNVCNMEIKAKTELGDLMLQKLAGMGLI